MSYVDPFGGSTVQPALVAYRSVTLTADVSLSWPRVAVDANYLARIMQVTATGAYSMLLPDARGASPGFDIIFTNPGATTYTVKTATGATICTVPAGVTQYVYLTDNSTESGFWSVLQFGSLSSAVVAASLVGPGIGASGSTLYSKLTTSQLSSDYSVVTSDRAKLFSWTGGVGTLTLPLASSATSDFFWAVANQGTGILTLSRQGSDTIDGASSIQLNLSESCYLATDGTSAWYTIGRGRSTQFNFTQLSKSITGGTITLTLSEAQNVVQIYSGVLVSNAIVVLPSTVQVYYISNQTTGAFTLTFKTAGVGTTVNVPTGQNAVLFCDGVNVINSSTTVSGISALTLSPGSAASPSINFTTGATTGIFSPAGDVVGISTAGAERVRIDASGNLGLGTTTMTGRFNVLAAASQTYGRLDALTTAFAYQQYALAGVPFGYVGQSSGIVSGGAGADMAIRSEAALAFSTGGSTKRMELDASGNVGIGVTPVYRLDVLSASATLANFKSGTTSAIMRIADSTADTGYIGSGSSLLAGLARTDFGLTANTGGALVLGSSNIERVRIDSTGDVTPGVDNGYRLGSASRRWNEVHGIQFIGGGAALTGLNASNVSTGTLANARTTGATAATANTLALRDANGDAAIRALTLGNTAVAGNVLDWYEEGNFTPTLTFGGLSVGMTFSSQVGKFTRIGNCIYWRARLLLSAKGSSTGVAGVSISGIGYASDGEPSPVSMFGGGFTGLTGTTKASFSSISSLGLWQTNSSGDNTAQLTDAAFTNSTDVQLSGFFFV